MKMETNEHGEVSVMSEVDISEELPNGDDSAFSTEQQHRAHGVQGVVNTDGHAVSITPVQTSDVVTIAPNQAGLTPEQVFVATSQGLLTADQLQEATVKTTHIVIHDQTFDGSGLKTPTTPIPPPTPATPNSRDKGLRYQWDDGIHLSVLPIRCKSSNGELYKNKFGSGGRGRCIKMVDNWYTPSEFEAVCGRASSKDWKRSIRYGGRPIQCLIEDGILQPHATSCTCAACCDDESVVSRPSTGPVRLFVPYKRRKRDSASSLPVSKRRSTSVSSSTMSHSPTKDNIQQAVTLVGQSPGKDTVVVSLAPNGSMGHPVRVGQGEAETIHIITADGSGNLVAEPTMVLPLQQPPKQPAPPTQNLQNLINMNDVNEQKNWWQLEEMANNLLQQVNQLKAMIEHAKQQSISNRNNFLEQVKLQVEKEKQEAVNAVRIEAQMNLSRAIIEERGQKDIAVQQALAQARAEMQEKIDSAVTVVTDADKVAYNVTWAQQPTVTQNHIEAIMDTVETEDGDQDKE